jgi:putative DNA primase/helicase
MNAPTRDSLIRALGGSETSGMCKCPAHDDETPSLKVSEGKDGKVLLHCHAGCSQAAVIAALRSQGRWGSCKSGIRGPSRQELAREARREFIAKRKRALNEQEQPVAQKSFSADERTDEERESYRTAFAILRRAAGSYGANEQRPSLPSPTQMLAKYFEGRGIAQVPENALWLSAQDSLRLTHKRFPAMVFPITGANGLQGAHITFLTFDSSKNLRSSVKKRNVRRVYGRLKGGYIQLGAPYDAGKPGIVAEGIENALAGSEFTGGLPAISAINVKNLAALNPPRSSEVIILPDSDARGIGEECADKLAERLSRSGRIVRMPVLTIPKKRNKWDYADELKRQKAKGGDGVVRLGQELLRFERFESERELQELVHPVGMESFMSLTFPSRSYLLRPWLTTTGLVMMDALPGHCKTYLAMSVAYSVASGTPLLSWSSEHRGRALYIDGELPGELLQKRLRELGPPLPETDLMVLSRSQFEMFGALMPDIATEEGRDYLDVVIEQHNFDLIILDSVSTLVRSGVENDVESWRAIQDWSLRHRARGRAIIYLHHQGRSGNPRGTSSREIVLDARLKLTADPELSNESETAVKIEYAKAREFFGADKAPIVAFLSTPQGRVTWRHETVAATTKEKVREFLNLNMKGTQIAKELHISPGRVSQIATQIRMEENQAKHVKKITGKRDADALGAREEE